jgi:hypothetical protein
MRGISPGHLLYKHKRDASAPRPSGISLWPRAPGHYRATQQEGSQEDRVDCSTAECHKAATATRRTKKCQSPHVTRRRCCATVSSSIYGDVLAELPSMLESVRFPHPEHHRAVASLPSKRRRTVKIRYRRRNWAPVLPSCVLPPFRPAAQCAKTAR